MKKIILLFIISIGFLYSDIRDINLSIDEREYIENKKEINMCVDPNWLPFEKIDENGKYIGILSEYIKLFSKKTNLKFKLQKTKTYQQSREYLRGGKCDIIVGDTMTNILKDSFLATKPYFITPRAFAIHQDTKGVQSFSQIVYKGNIGVLRSSPMESILKERYKDIDIVSFLTTSDGLNAISNKSILTYVEPISSIAYSIQNSGLANVNIGGTFESEVKLSVLVNKELPELVVILNKSIDSISKNDKIEILNMWTKITYKKSIDYSLLWQIIALFLIVLIVIYIAYLKQKKLHQEIKILNQELEEKIKKEVDKSTKQLQILQQQTKMAQMGEMIGAIAHQWRQPLNTITTGIQNLKYDYMEGKLEDEQFVKEFINEQKNTIKFMSRTIDDFRNFFRVDKEKSNFYIKKSIESVVTMLSSSIDKNSIQLNISGDEFEYFGFESEFQQVVMNIINNAKDILIEKNIENPIIDIVIEKNKITIEDNAGGIPKDIIDKIFDSYFTTKGKDKGTGMGLYMSKMIIEENMGGVLSIKNEGAGAKFTINLGRVK